MEQAFAPPGESWVGVSPQLRAMRRTLTGVVAGVVAVGIGIGFTVAGSPIGAGSAVVGVVAIAAAAFIAIGRNYASWGYAERAEDLLVTRGVLLRRLVVVPYGRMQLVDLSAGPFERKFGITTVRLHTAAPGTDARIRGLAPAEAARLRDRLAALGEAQSAGL